jgi:hypothetical protein
VKEDRVATVLAADPEAGTVAPEVDPGAEAVDAADRGHDITSRRSNRAGRGVAEPSISSLRARVLLDVMPPEVRFRLGVVEVADEVLDRVVREELGELRVQLGRQRLVVGEDEGRPVVAGDDVRHRERLARAGHAKERLVAHPPAEAVGEPVDGGGLVTGRLEVGDELEVGHPATVPPGLDWNNRSHDSPIRGRSTIARRACRTRRPSRPGRTKEPYHGIGMVRTLGTGFEWPGTLATRASAPRRRPCIGQHGYHGGGPSGWSLEYKDNSRRSRFIIVLGVAMALLAGGGAVLPDQPGPPAGVGGPGQLVPVVVAARSIPERHTITAGDPRRRPGSGRRRWVGDVQRSIEVARPDHRRRDPSRPADRHELIASTIQGGEFSILKPDETIAPDSPNWRAVSITVAPDLAVGGMLEVGMDVDVFLTATVAAPASAQPSGRFITDKSTKVVYQDIEILARDKDFYVIRLPEQQAEEILHLQATAAVTISMALRPSEDTRTADATKLGETTNLIISRYGLPIPQTIVVGPGGATSVDGGQSYSGYQPSPSPAPSPAHRGAAASPSPGP